METTDKKSAEIENKDNISEKKPKRKKKKIIIISLVVILAVLFGGGFGAVKWYCQKIDVRQTVSVMSNAAYQKDADLHIIAHRGASASTPENTYPAFEKAGKMGYYGAECDTYMTSDGVWVISHDPNTYRMMNKAGTIESMTFTELDKLTYNNGANIKDYPNLKICTLEEYLSVCAKYKLHPFIELKSEKNTEHYDKIINLVNKYDLMKSVTFISFHIENLQAIRKLTTEPRVLYLVNEINDESIKSAKNLGGVCGIDFDAGREENNGTMVKKCIDNGLVTAAWTVDDMKEMDKLYSWGVHYITTNCIAP